MRRSWRRGLAAHPREGTAGFGGGSRQRRAAGAECAGPSGADASSLPWLCYRLLYCGCIPEPPSPAAGRPSPQTSPLLADGTRPQRGHLQLPGEPESRAHHGRAWWDGVWEKHEAERREGKAPDEAGGPEPRRTGRLFRDQAASATCRLPPDSCWTKQGDSRSGDREAASL